MIERQKLFDPKCLELAEHFLPSTASDGLKAELAFVIQEAVEAFCEDEAACVSIPKERRP